MQKNSASQSGLFHPRVVLAPLSGALCSVGVFVAMLSFAASAISLAAGNETMANPSSTTTVSDVRALQLTSGGKAAVSYLVTHDILGHVDPGTPLAGARIARSQYPDVYAGVWGADYGGLRAWLTPPSDYAFLHGEFSPISRLKENTYFTDRLLSSPEGTALEAGDRAQLAIADTIANAPLPWDRQRGAATGTLAWDYGTDYRQVSATYNGVSATADAILIRADLVARGGDVDARAAPTTGIAAPPLVIDLPHTYSNDQSASYIAAIMAPYTAYVPGVHLEVQPKAGKAVLTVFVKGYLYEAKEYTLPGGGEVKEWHIPVQAVILLTPDGGGSSPLMRHAAARMPQGGVAVASDGAVAKSLQVPTGGTVQAGVGIAPEVVDSGGNIVASPASEVAALTSFSAPANRQAQDNASATSGVGDSSPWLIDELMAAAPINASLSSPVDLLLGDKTYALTLDPDYRGEGVLALRGLRRAATGTQYANTVAIPFAVIDGVPIKLTRSRLLDLRVLPMYAGPILTFGGQTPPRTEYVEGTVFPFGLDIQAVYDLDNDRYAFLEFVARPQLDSPSFVTSYIVVLSINGEAVQAAPIQYVELPEEGPVSYGGVTQTREFSGSVDLLSVGGSKTLTIGNHILAPSILKSGVDGMLTVLQAPAPLTPNPLPDSTKSISGQPLAFYYGPPSATTTQISLVDIDIVSDGTSVPNPAPIGQQCIAPQIIDTPTPDAPPDQDIKSAWFDADDANLYATIALTDVPAAAPSGHIYSWSVHWRYEHVGKYARATLDSSGQWTFDTGGYNNQFYMLNNVSGDVQPGANGFIRIWVPRNLLGYRNGELLRETSAHSWVDVYTSDVDSAPEGTNATYGSGGDYMVGPACTVIPPRGVVSRKIHGAAGAFDINLPLTGNPGIECRSGDSGGNHEIIVMFPTAISCNSARLSRGNGSISSFIVDDDATRVTVSLTSVVNAQSIVVALNVSDGRNTGDISIPMDVLLADTTADRSVNSADIGQTKSQSGHLVTSSNFREDVTVDGSINSADIGLVKSKSGTALP
jgi:hypothetical protein